MEPNNVNFKLLSLNARGIRTFEKRKAIFNWLSKSGGDICFLQETYSTREVENIWKKQWRGDLYFSHGTCHSKGVLLLVKGNLDFSLQKVMTDPEGRYIMLYDTNSSDNLRYHLQLQQEKDPVAENCRQWPRFNGNCIAMPPSRQLTAS